MIALPWLVPLAADLLAVLCIFWPISMAHRCS